MAPRINEALKGYPGTTPPSDTNRFLTEEALAGGVVTSVTATAPISSSGGTTPNITHDTAGTAGTYGGAASVPVVTTNATGHVTGVAPTAIAIDTSQITSGALGVARGGTGLSSPGASGNVLTSNGSAWVSSTPAGGLTNWTDGISTSAPNATVPVASLRATNAATNVDAAIVPKGTGSLLASVPDATATGGNKRGTNAVDLQTSRGAATNVASGTASGIPCGASNTAAGNYSSANGGQSNTIASGATHSGTVAGQSNSITSGATHSGSLGGQSHSISSDHSAAVGGFNSVIDGPFCVAVGGQHGTPRGVSSKTVFPVTFFATAGDAQAALHQTLRITTTATPAALTTTAFAPNVGTVNTLPNNGAFVVRAQVIGRDQTSGDVKAWEIMGLVKRGASAAATALVGSPTVTVIGADAGAAAWAATLIADTTYGAVEIQVTGEAGKTIHWVGSMLTTEVQ